MKSLMPCLMLSMLLCCVDSAWGQWCGRICGPRIQRSCCPPPLCVNRCSPRCACGPPVMGYRVLPSCVPPGTVPSVIPGQIMAPQIWQYDQTWDLKSTAYRQCVLSCLNLCPQNNDSLLHSCIGQCYCQHVLKLPDCPPSPCAAPGCSGTWGSQCLPCR